MSAQDLGCTLLTIARSAIGERLGLAVPEVPHDATLQRRSATFVTLRQASGLRGCIGSLEPLPPLGLDVRENAIAAAFRDPRFAPLAADEFGATALEVSLLSPAEPIEVCGEQDLLGRLRPGIDGLTLEYGGSRATFLPQVWQALPDPRDFLSSLKRKLGLPAGFWDADVAVRCYTVTKWAEPGFGPGAQA